jgi:uncharacterized protein
MMHLNRPSVGLSFMREADFFLAAKPLFELGEVEILEWSFDMGWGGDPLPDYCSALLSEYSKAKQLIGHGVTFSILSGQWTSRQELWLECLKEELELRDYQHITEHFGFMTAGNFHRSAPLPVPLTSATLELGQHRMQLLANICKTIPLGLENLALAFGFQDLVDQGRFIAELIRPVDGFLLLDLHNLYCQTHNFNVDPLLLMKSYPLDKVREIHVSGGSWSIPSSSSKKVIRRDTHDERIPQEVFDLVKLALPLCPNVKAVIFEQLGNALTNEASRSFYRQDFLYLKSVVKECYQQVNSGDISCLMQMNN